MTRITHTAGREIAFLRASDLRVEIRRNGVIAICGPTQELELTPGEFAAITQVVERDQIRAAVPRAIARASPRATRAKRRKRRT